MRSGVLRIIVLGTLIVAGATAYRMSLAQPPLPPILRKATAGGGWWGACPPVSKPEETMMSLRPLALSPELNKRLAAQFPPGTEQNVIVIALAHEGFATDKVCPNDRSIHIAWFNSKAITASIFWKVDEVGTIVWTKGFIAYNGL
jgi:hypothetical protein